MVIEERIIEEYTDFGDTIVYLKNLMDEKGITVYQMSKLTKIKYEAIKSYYDGICCRFDDKTLAKICYILKCEINDIIKYVSPNI